MHTSNARNWWRAKNSLSSVFETVLSANRIRAHNLICAKPVGKCSKETDSVITSGAMAHIQAHVHTDTHTHKSCQLGNYLHSSGPSTIAPCLSKESEGAGSDLYSFAWVWLLLYGQSCLRPARPPHASLAMTQREQEGIERPPLASLPAAHCRNWFHFYDPSDPSHYEVGVLLTLQKHRKN